MFSLLPLSLTLWALEKKVLISKIPLVITNVVYNKYILVYRDHTMPKNPKILVLIIFEKVIAESFFITESSSLPKFFIIKFFEF